MFNKLSTIKKLIWLFRLTGGSTPSERSTITGTSPLSLLSALAKPIKSLIQHGKCTVSGSNITCNNGVLSVVDGEIVVTGTPEEITVSASGADDQTATAENLFSVDDIADTQDIISGTVTRRCEPIISDGTTPSGRYIGTVGDGNILVTVKETGYTGAIASFETDKAEPLNGLVCEMRPVQDLHGYDNPWPAGGGSNKLMLTGRSAVTSGAWGNSTLRDFSEPHAFIGISSDGYFYNGYISSYTITEESVTLTTTNNGFGVGLSYSCQPETQYTFSYDNKEVGMIGFGFYDADGAYLSFAGTGTLADYTFTTPANCVNLMIVFRPPRDIEKTYTHPVLSIGSSATWKPYANECPITGHTGVDVTQTGKNLLSSEVVHGLWTALGVFYSHEGSSSKYITTKNIIPVVGGETYKLSYINDTNNNIAAISYNAYRNGEIIVGGIYITVANGIINVPSGTDSITLNFILTNDITSISEVTTSSFQLELGSTATPYEPYTGTTIPITFPDEAGTVFGGTLDVVSGVLTCTMASVDLGTVAWIKNTNATKTYFQTIYEISDMKKSTGNGIIQNILCSQYAAERWSYTLDREGYDCTICEGYREHSYIAIYNESCVGMTAAEFKTAMSGVQLVYELATPQTYQLDPVTVQTLLGQNNIFSNTNGDTTAYVSDGITEEKVAPQKLTTSEGDNTITVTAEVEDIVFDVTYVKEKEG